MRRTPVVVWKDFLDASRSKLLWGVMAVFAALVIVMYVALWWAGSDPTALDIVGPASAIMQLVVPLLGLIVGYRSIVSERQSGSIKILLSLPPSRGAVVAGKFIGRSLVMVAALLVAFVTFVIMAGVLFQEFPLADFAGIAVTSAMVGITFVGIAVGVSGAVASRGRAMALVVGLYLVFLLFWDLITAGAYRLLMGELPDAGPVGEWEAWYIFLQWLNPIEAFSVVSDAVLDESFGAFTIPLFAPQEVSDVDAIVVGDVPWYLDTWVAVALLVIWAIVPVVIGYARFNRADLG